MKTLFGWLHRAFSEGDGSPSTKRVVFVGAVAAAIILCFADFAANRSLTINCVSLATAALTAAGGAYVGGRFAERNEK